MNSAFESEKNRKAFIYTVVICGILLLLFILISWKIKPPAEPVVQDLMEINLGNNDEGFGEEQPLIRGNRTSSKDNVPASAVAATRSEQPVPVTPDDNAPDDAAPVEKQNKNTTKPKSVIPVPVITPVAKPKVPKITYPGSETGPPGNNESEDNRFKNQGKNPDKIGDDGLPEGHKDAFGTEPGGKIGGPKITSGNRRIQSVGNYSFTGNLSRATIYAVIKVSPAGKGTFIKLVKPSTSFDQRYAVSISDYLSTIKFYASEEESSVTVQFNFTVN